MMRDRAEKKTELRQPKKMEMRFLNIICMMMAKTMGTLGFVCAKVASLPSAATYTI